MRVLGIETSCDETAAAVVEDGHTLLSNVIASSVDLHVAYGGVVPEIAARSHIESIIPVIQQALADTKTDWAAIDAIAVTYGPGLSGSLLIGTTTAATLAITQHKPLYPINHVAAHAYAAFLTDTPLTNYALPANQPAFPILSLIVSGGHTQLVLFRSHTEYQIIGQTADDAVGEAFDKVAKILGLPYPGGPNVSAYAERGNPTAIPLPIAKMAHPYDFSFSGLKTAVLRAVQELCGKSYDFPSFELAALLNEQQQADVAASFQATAIQTLVNKAKLACDEFKPRSFILAGGVAANTALRAAIESRIPTDIFLPDFKLCTDNAAMIAALGCYQIEYGMQPRDPNTVEPHPTLSM